MILSWHPEADSRKQLTVNNLVERHSNSWAERAVLLLLIGFMCVHTLPKAWKSLITDFPNYYLSARLAHEGFDTARMYEWKWLQREKDHRAIDVKAIGLIPITPFSTLFISPLTAFPPLTAKRIWILLNLTMLFPIGWLLHSMIGLGYRRIALAFVLCFPLYRNLEFGQFYVFLLLLIVAACWAYLRGLYALAGSLLALAAACKIFPIILVVLLLRRRAWRALACGLTTGVVAFALSVLVFGWNVQRTYIEQILPWALHGDAMPPYFANASISGILHLLFLPEPQWNPNPWHPSAFWYALLMPTLQLLVLAPAILMINRRNRASERIMLEWSALLTASLVISTVPALYNFVLLVLPMCVMSAVLLRRRQYGLAAALLVAYIGIGLPMPATIRPMGLAILLNASRLPLILCFLAGIYWLLWIGRAIKRTPPDWSQFGWVAFMVVTLAFSVRSTYIRESAERLEYAFRLPVQPQGFLNAEPRSVGGELRYIAFTLDGYNLIPRDPEDDPSADDLSFAGGSGQLWVERSKDSDSVIGNFLDKSEPHINDARDPIISENDHSLAFVRDDHGRGQLIVRKALESMTAAEIALTPLSLNVYEAAYQSEGEYAFSATANGGVPQIYLTDATHRNQVLDLGESRYPALSPDGQWLAYSRLEDGVWNLWLWNRKSGANQRIGNIPCNEIEPSWYADSKTLLYGTDCGRSLWFTAVARRRVIP